MSSLPRHTPSHSARSMATTPAGIHWAPASLPLQRRRETAAVIFWIALGPFIALSLALLLWYSSWCRAAMAVYVGWWLLLDAETPKRGGRALAALQGTALAVLAADYFPLNVYMAEPAASAPHTSTPHDDDEGGDSSGCKREEMAEPTVPPLLPANKAPTMSPYPADQPHIFCLHPHGIAGLSWITSLALDARSMRRRIGLDIRIATVSANFRIPLWRDLIMGLGFVDASKASAAYQLAQRRNLGIVIGGAREALDAHPQRFDLTLARRTGFVRLALKYGASLVPCLSFGENELFSQVPNPPGSAARKLQDAMIRTLGFTLPAVYGRGIFQYSLGLLPHRHPLHVVWGQPMRVPQVHNPTDEDIARVHAQYVRRLRDMYEAYAPQFAGDLGQSTTPAVRERWWLARRGSAATPKPRVGGELEFENLMQDGDKAAEAGEDQGGEAAGSPPRSPPRTAEDETVQQGDSTPLIPPFRIVA